MLAGLQKMWLVGVLQLQPEDLIPFNVQERRKHDQDEAAICLQAFVPGSAQLSWGSSTSSFTVHNTTKW